MVNIFLKHFEWNQQKCAALWMNRLETCLVECQPCLVHPAKRLNHHLLRGDFYATKAVNSSQPRKVCFCLKSGEPAVYMENS